MLPADIDQALVSGANRIGVFGDRLRFFSEVSSTNDVALGLAAEGAEDGTIVLAESQTSGRGRRGREWFSPAVVGLYFSIILRGVYSPSITLMAGVATTEGIRAATGAPILIKWPNDLVVEGAGISGKKGKISKIGGILAETCQVKGAVDAVVIGIGINVTTTEYPTGFPVQASSLEREVGKKVERALVFIEVLAAMSEWRLKMLQGYSHVMLGRWSELAPMSKETEIQWVEGNESRHGITKGIDIEGALLVLSNGKIERLRAGDVEWRDSAAQ
tara:strand:+ start:13940 stop:14761 length:822 start_codon:yes stop_codon:yes gene_type:complete